MTFFKKENFVNKPFKVQLIKASADAYPIVQNLARFYCYDISRTCGFIEDWDWVFPENGLYEGLDVKSYFEDKDRAAFLVKIADELAGFVLIHKKGINPNTEWNMGQFFIVAKFQGKGVGKQAAHLAWQQFPGLWEVTVIPENTPALAFWRKTINDFTNGHYSEEIKSVSPNTHQPNRHILSFKAP